MAEPDNLVLDMLRDMRASIASLSEQVAGVDRRLAHIEEQQSDLALQVTYSLGLGTTANLKAQTAFSRADAVEHRIDELVTRLESMEAR